ncbi:MAG: hypothetical protein ABGX04_07840 [Myxococcales bacterium]|nr:hypothetical protein [Myxococcales bacterium]HIK84309.1 hypothetical protein [Myxococcales bacterium]
MKNRSRFAGLFAWAPLLAAALFAGVASFAGAASLEIGAKVPDFEFLGEGGILHRRSAAEGSQGVSRGAVVAWFPKAFTPG